MKKTNYLLMFLGACFLLLTGFLLLSNKKASKENKADNLDRKSFTITQTYSVPIPDQVDFCGETIVLDRFDLRERFDREINQFTYLHSTTLLYLKRANRYFPIIEPILRRNGVPDDFKYLCIIESNLDIRALSPVNAAGLWQFMESTGKEFGLEINSEVDERYHIEKATDAACSYLKDAHSKFGSWIDAAAAYNAGMTKISSSLTNQLVNSALDLLLVSETSRYVFRISAIKQLFENPSFYGFTLQKEDLYPSIPIQRVIVTETISDLAFFAQGYGLNYMILKEFNPWLRDKKLTVRPGRSYEIAIPKREDLYFGKNAPVVHDERWLSPD